MASVTRTVRFKKEEGDLIDEFLRRNPFLDFSTLARLSIARFIDNPELKIRRVESKSGRHDRRHSRNEGN